MQILGAAPNKYSDKNNNKRVTMDYKLKVRKAIAWFVPLISWVTWNGLKALVNGGLFFNIREEDWDEIEERLAKNHYVILTRNATHLSTYFVAVGNKIATGKWGYWGHALMNLEDTNTPTEDDFRLVEATSKGVHYSTFFEVFTCDSVALLKPKGLTHEQWLRVMNKAKTELGKPYDNLMDLTTDQDINCVELVRVALQSLPDYDQRFANLEAMIKEHGNNLTPDMLYECPDFEIVFEVRR